MSKTEIIYAPAVIEFTQVALEYCRALETAAEAERTDWLRRMSLLVPMLYIKARMLPEADAGMSAALNITQVSEADYDYVRHSVARLLGDDDEYLALAPRTEGQTEETCWATLSEHLADAYQPVRNFLAAYQSGLADNMREALAAVRDDFEAFWGESLAESMPALHRLVIQ